MRISLAKGLIASILLSTLHAGLTDFKTIEAAKAAYDAKAYSKSAALFIQLPNATPQKEFDLGDAYYKSKNYKAALEAYEKAKGEGVDEAQRLHNIGNTYFMQNKLDKAIKAYESALKIREDKDTRFNLELAKRKKQQQEQKKKQQQKEQQKNQKQNKKQDQQKKSGDQQKKDQQKKQKEQNKKQDSQQQKEQKSQQNKQGKQGQKQQDKQQKQNSSSQKEKEKKKSQQKPQDPQSSKEKKEGKQQQKSPRSGDQKQKKKGTEDAAGTGAKKTMSQEEKMRQAELKRLLKKMGQKKTPTMMYQMNSGKPKPIDKVNPW